MAANFHRTPFVGRASYLTRLSAALSAATSGSPLVALVAGEAGIGKTRLLDEFALVAEKRGVRLLRGGASESDGAPPYLPVTDALAAHITSDSMRDLSTPDRALLATVFPILDAGAKLISTSSDRAQWRLYEAFTALFRAWARVQPILLILDDLQWADAATLDLLVHIVRRLEGARFLLVGAYRSEELATNDALRRATIELNRLRRLVTFTLAPLNRDEIESLAARWSGQPVSAALSSALLNHCEGNPFFAEELLAYWQENDAMTPTERGLALDFDAPEFPPSILVTVQRRVTRLPLDLQDALKAAAFIGSEFDLDTLSALVNQPAARLESLLTPALEAAFVTRTGATRYCFVHDHIRAALRALVPPLHRRALHKTVGTWLESQLDSGSAPALSEIAHHMERGGEVEKAMRYAALSGDLALRQAAFADAARTYELALRLLPPDDAGRGAAIVRHGGALLLAGQTEPAIERLERAAVWFRDRGDLVAQGEALHRVGNGYWRMERLAEARQAFERASGCLSGNRGAPRIALLADYAALLGISFHELDRAIALATEAHSLAMQNEEGSLVIQSKRTLGTLMIRANDLAGGTDLIIDAMRLAEQEQNKGEIVACRSALSMPYFWQSRVREAQQNVLALLALAEASGDPFQLRHVYSELAMVYLLLGEVTQAATWLEKAAGAVERLDNPEAAAFAELVQGVAAYYRGDLVSAESYFLKMVDTLSPIGEVALVWHLGWLGITQAALGKRAEAERIAARISDLLATVPHPSMPAAELLSHLTIMALLLDDQPRFVSLEPRLLPYEGQYHDALVDRLLAMIALRGRRWQPARERLERAEQSARGEGLAMELPFVLSMWVELERAEHGALSDRARRTGAEAVTLYRRLGNAGAADQLESGLKAPHTRAAYPAGLTEREIEVLRLVVRGMSNRDISAALSVSVKTVERHLTSIFNKTTTDNRAAATAFAVRHHLV